MPKGGGVKKSEADATRWYSEAANKQEPEAEYQVAMMLLRGKGGYEQDETKGLEWLKKAAGHGHLEARKELAKREG